MSLPLTCTMGAPIAGGHYADTHGPGYPVRPVPCNQPAVTIVLEEQEVWHAGDVQENILTAYPYCAEHGHEQVHEMRATSNPDDFTVVSLEWGLVTLTGGGS